MRHVSKSSSEHPFAVTRSSPTRPWLQRCRAAARGSNDDDLIVLQEITVDVLLVRPGKGVWRTTADLGGDGDKRTAGPLHLAVAIGELHMIRGGKLQPPRILPSDTVVIINPRTLALYLAQGGR